MLFSNIKRNKESIIYFIVTLVCLETVRINHNKLEDRGRRENWKREDIQKEKRALLTMAGVIYGFFLSLVLLNIPLSLTDKITSVYPDTSFLKTNTALIVTLVMTYLVSVMISKALLSQYIIKLNGMTQFWQKLGRSAWDGTKIVATSPVKASGYVLDKMVQGTKYSVCKAGSMGKKGKNFTEQSLKKSFGFTKRTIKFVITKLRNIIKK